MICIPTGPGRGGLRRWAARPGAGALTPDHLAMTGVQAAGPASAVQVFQQRDHHPAAGVQRLPGRAGGERLVEPGQLAEMRAFLRSGGKTLTETWSYPWRAEAQG